MDSSPPPVKHATALGVLCGAGAALCWALGFVAARHGVLIGLSPLVIALHRFVWPGLALIPVLAADGFKNLGGMGWRRGIAITVFGGLPLALWSYIGYLYVPLGHGAIIQPSCASLGGMILARLVLKEALPARRIVGALAMVLGLAVIGAEALGTMGRHGLIGDLLFVAAGSFFAVFGMLLRLWRIPPMRAAAVTSVLSLAGLPILLLGTDSLVAAGFLENLMQARSICSRARSSCWASAAPPCIRRWCRHSRC
jgi:drug/metabolite transporter (DMT)-like permease